MVHIRSSYCNFHVPGVCHGPADHVRAVEGDGWVGPDGPSVSMVGSLHLCVCLHEDSQVVGAFQTKPKRYFLPTAVDYLWVVPWPDQTLCSGYSQHGEFTCYHHYVCGQFF